MFFVSQFEAGGREKWNVGPRSFIKSEGTSTVPPSTGGVVCQCKTLGVENCVTSLAPRRALVKSARYRACDGQDRQNLVQSGFMPAIPPPPNMHCLVGRSGTRTGSASLPYRPAWFLNCTQRQVRFPPPLVPYWLACGPLLRVEICIATRFDAGDWLSRDKKTAYKGRGKNYRNIFCRNRRQFYL